MLRLTDRLTRLPPGEFTLRKKRLDEDAWDLLVHGEELYHSGTVSECIGALEAYYRAEGR